MKSSKQHGGCLMCMVFCCSTIFQVTDSKQSSHKQNNWCLIKAPTTSTAPAKEMQAHEKKSEWAQQRTWGINLHSNKIVLFTKSN